MSSSAKDSGPKPLSVSDFQKQTPASPSPNPRPAMEQVHRERADRAIAISSNLFKTLDVYSNGRVYLDCEDLQRLKVDCTGLDLDSGRPANGGPVFVEPYDVEPLQHLLTGGDDEFQWDRQWDPFDRSYRAWNNRDLGDWQRAQDVIDVIANYVNRYSEISERMTGVLRRPSKEKEGKFRDEVVAWTPDWYGLYVVDAQDPAIPHSTGLLAQSWAMRDDQLSFAELYAVAYLTRGRVKSQGYLHHRIIPATVISLAERDARIVQGYVDDESGDDVIKIRKSKILALDEWDVEKFKVLLSWVMGKPVGDTTYKDHSPKGQQRQA